MMKENTNPTTATTPATPTKKNGVVTQDPTNPNTILIVSSDKEEAEKQIAKHVRKEEKTMKKETTKPATSKPAKEEKEKKPVRTRKPASIAEDSKHFELIIPKIEKGGKVGEWAIVANEDCKKPLAIPTKTADNNIMLADVQHAILSSMKTKASLKVADLKKKKKEKPEKFTETNQLDLDQQEALLKCINTQIKKYTASKHNPVADLATAVMLKTPLNINVKPIVANIRTSYNDLFEVVDKLYKGETVKLTADQQAQITDIKKSIISIATPYTAEVKAGETLVFNKFPLSIGNKDIVKLLMSLYQSYNRNGKGDMVDGLKLDGKEEKQLQVSIQNLIYARMTGAK